MSDLAYDTAGQDEPPLLFLHGWCGDRSFFGPQFEYFSATHRVVSVDLPGHGQSPAPSEYAVEAFATDVAALARRLGVRRVVAFGHSLGAMVALALSQQAPELVSAVVMVDPPPLSKEVWQGFAAQLIPSFQGPMDRTAAASSSSKCSSPPTTPTDAPRSSRPCAQYPTTPPSRWLRPWPRSTRSLFCASVISQSW